jgi:hypothetical protein
MEKGSGDVLYQMGMWLAPVLTAMTLGDFPSATPGKFPLAALW